jgi:hypothetical protein
MEARWIMDPNQVLSPRKRLRELRVLHIDADENWSLAEFNWRHPDGTWRRRVGMRWNGADGELGHPASSGYSTWFVLPDGSKPDELIKALLQEKRDT